MQLKSKELGYLMVKTLVIESNEPPMSDFNSYLIYCNLLALKYIC